MHLCEFLTLSYFLDLVSACESPIVIDGPAVVGAPLYCTLAGPRGPPRLTADTSATARDDGASSGEREARTPHTTPNLYTIAFNRTDTHS